MTPLNLHPARWIWYPSRRTLPNTFVAFRRELHLSEPVLSATGWIAADSRYRLEVNGERVQWGGAPCDPRFLEADPVDLTPYLTVGDNVIGVLALFYGHGDGTSPTGKPGVILRLELRFQDGRMQVLTSDEVWKAHLCRAWMPGQHKRDFVRSLQEDFDARAYPYGWSRSGFVTDADWLPAMPMSSLAHQTPISSDYRDHLFDASSPESQLLQRQIPLLEETIVPAERLVALLEVTWIRPPEEYFEMNAPNAYTARLEPIPEASDDGWSLEFAPEQSVSERCVALTFEFTEQLVGFPRLTVIASAGTIIEMLTHEGHDPRVAAIINTHHHTWTRFTLTEGENHLESFDFESLRWMQVIVRGASGSVKIRGVSVRRRSYPFQTPDLSSDDADLERVFAATFNTLRNSLQDAVVDGMGRERQQYSGDASHQLQIARVAFGDSRLSARFLNTYAAGQSFEGYFLDCYPAHDRLVRVGQRQVGLTPWGPILDHSLGFIMDTHDHWMQAGDDAPLSSLLPRFQRFQTYLERGLDADGLLPVDGWGVPMVWLDHEAYLEQAHKRCAFNLYAAATLTHALAPIARHLGDERCADAALEFGAALLSCTTAVYWDEARGVFSAQPVNEASPDSRSRLCDRSLATAVLYNQCPDARVQPSLELLASPPPELGLSYPANAVWRMRALIHGARIQPVLRELRERWATMPSVKLNNTLSEFWHAIPDTDHQWSHCAAAPLVAAYTGIAGLQPLEPGYRRARLRPQLGDLTRFQCTARTPHGELRLEARGGFSARELTVDVPPTVTLELEVSPRERLPLSQIDDHRYLLPPGSTTLTLTDT
jgi:alpha-L-rhamnosidase